jgi:hypothetical protein
MDYYQSTRPEVDDSGLSGGVSFKLGGQIAVANIGRPQFYSPQPQDEGGGGGTYPLTICVDGVPQILNVYTDGGP